MKKDIGKTSAGKMWNKIGENIKRNTITIPSIYQRIKNKLPDDMGIPKDAIAFGMNNGETSAMLLMFQVDEESSMPFDDAEKIIEILHETMGENEGVIEVGCGDTKNGNKYAYDILKHKLKINGELARVEYTLNINVKFGDVIMFINSSFIEVGMTGLRDSIGMEVFTRASKDCSMEEIIQQFYADPYNKGYKKGFLMNFSEIAEFDEKFPHHPLSEARRLAEFIIGMN